METANRSFITSDRQSTRLFGLLSFVCQVFIVFKYRSFIFKSKYLIIVVEENAKEPAKGIHKNPQQLQYQMMPVKYYSLG